MWYVDDHQSRATSFNDRDLSLRFASPCPPSVFRFTNYSQRSAVTLDQTTLASSVILGIRYDFSTRAWDALTTSIREGTHLTTNEYVSISFFDEDLTVSEISWTGIIGSSFLSVNDGFFSW